jgi:hypothetical protein
MIDRDNNDEVDDNEDDEDTLGSTLFDDVDEEGSVLADLKDTIKSLFKTLDYDQKEELIYILDNIESVPWDWKKWVK